MTSNLTQALALAFLLLSFACATYGQPDGIQPAITVSQEFLTYDIMPGVQRDVGSEHLSKWSCPIPYILDSSLEIDTNNIIAAMDYIMSKTGWTFVPRSSQADYIRFVDKDDGCWSYVGRQGGEQLIGIDDFCVFASIVHEIGHAIGIQHEQTRADRDLFVNINWWNIRAGSENNFEMDSVTWNSGDYDFNSVMHYDQWGFASNLDYKVITPIVSTEGVCYIGQRSELSADDIIHFNALIDGPACSTPVSEACDPTNIKLCGVDTALWGHEDIYREYEIVGTYNGKNYYASVTPLFTPTEKILIYWLDSLSLWAVSNEELGSTIMQGYNFDAIIEGSTNWFLWNIHGRYWQHDPKTMATENECVSATSLPTPLPSKKPSLAPSNRPSMLPSDYPSISPSAEPSVSPSANSSAPIIDDGTIVNSGKLSDVAIIGIIIGCIVSVFAVVCIVDNYYEKRKVKPMSSNQPILYGVMQSENA
eukprot:482350_1